MKSITFGTMLLLCASLPLAQETSVKRHPIIDMHLHGGSPGRFRTEPDGTPLRRPCRPAPCRHYPAQVQKLGDILPMTLAQMDKHNVVLGVMSDRPPPVDWKAVEPDRFRLGFLMNHPSEISLPELREYFKSGKVRVLGELALQYERAAIDDPLLEPMFAMAEELDIPVHIHLAGTGGGTDFPIHLGNPLRLSTVLQKHQNLRIYIENASWPFLEEITSVMYNYPNVYADVASSR